MLSREEIAYTVDTCTYKDWHFRLEPKGDGYLVQARFAAPDYSTPARTLTLQGGRKWYISRHACRTEIVNTLLKAVLSAEEHEAREAFRYGGRRIYNPHLSVNRLWDLTTISAAEEHRDMPPAAAAVGT